MNDVSYERAMQLCRIRDRLKPMLEAQYEGENYVIKPINGSDCKYSCKLRKTTLAEARKRIARAVEQLNLMANELLSDK